MFLYNDTATTEIYTLSLHDALPIWSKESPMGPTPRRTNRDSTGRVSRRGKAAVRAALRKASPPRTSRRGGGRALPLVPRLPHPGAPIPDSHRGDRPDRRGWRHPGLRRGQDALVVGLRPARRGGGWPQTRPDLRGGQRVSGTPRRGRTRVQIRRRGGPRGRGRTSPRPADPRRVRGLLRAGGGAVRLDTPRNRPVRSRRARR